MAINGAFQGSGFIVSSGGGSPRSLNKNEKIIAIFTF